MDNLGNQSPVWLGLKAYFPSNKLNGAKEQTQALCLLHCHDGPFGWSATEMQNPLLVGLDLATVCLSRNFQRKILWTRWPWFSTKLFHQVNFWPLLTDHMQYFRMWKISILHLRQPHKDCCTDLFSHLLSLKFKKILWKILEILWFLILNSSWKFLWSLINGAFFLVLKTV